MKNTFRTNSILALILISLGCNFFTDPVAPTEVPVELLSVTATPRPRPTPTDVELLPTFMPTSPPETTPRADEDGLYHQWATAAVASSEYSSPAWSAQQATGEPDTVICGDYETAWASFSADTVEWLELSFSVPVAPIEINIHQSYSPSQVVKVEVLTIEGETYEVYSGDPESVDDCPYVLSVGIDGIMTQVERVRITVDQSEFTNWNEIDAVELVGIADRIIDPESEAPAGYLGPEGRNTKA